MDEVQKLLRWYDAHARDLPWRYQGGRYSEGDGVPNLYFVWLAEIMLQQTLVATVKDYFCAFIARWDSFAALAAADEQEVMAAWAGLGYYARARNMLKSARIIVAEYDAILPQSEARLLKLPGIGPYTAAAIAAIGFDAPAAPVDGNIERVVARLHKIMTPIPALKVEVRAHMQVMMDNVERGRRGDFVQAMMDLGATICKPRNADCAHCPWNTKCAAYRAGMVAELPIRPPKKPRPTRTGIVWWLENHRGCVLMIRRPARGLLGGMLAFPSSGWDNTNETQLPQYVATNKKPEWQHIDGEIVHVFTHFRLCLRIRRHVVPKGFRAPSDHQWVHPRDFAAHALPSLMRKVAAHMPRHAT